MKRQRADSNTTWGGAHLNRSEIWGDIKRESLGLKWVGNTTNGIRPLILYFKFQFSKSIKSSTLMFSSIKPILCEIYLFPKMIKNHSNIYTKPTNSGYTCNELSIEISRRLKRDRDISRKAVLATSKQPSSVPPP